MASVTDEIYSQARAALLDGLEALGAHIDSVVLVGAQAIYLHTAEAEFNLPPFTRDGDLVLDRPSLSDAPLLDDLLRGAGFQLSDQPGTWLNRDGVPLDLLVPEGVAGPGGRRTTDLGSHNRRAARRTVGLEAALVDNAPMTITGLSPNDVRRIEVRVAGSAALVIAKAHKVGERLTVGRNVDNKDAFDLYRLFRHSTTQQLQQVFEQLRGSGLATVATAQAIGYLNEFFSSPELRGCELAQEALGVLDPARLIAPSLAALVQDLLQEL